MNEAATGTTEEFIVTKEYRRCAEFVRPGTGRWIAA
jgi:hypothetical protein